MSQNHPARIWLRYLYHDRGHSTASLADRYGIGIGTVRRRLGWDGPHHAHPELDAHRDGTPTAPTLPVNPDVEYCERCGRSGDLQPCRVGGQPMALCGRCIETAERRAARGGPPVRVGGPD